MEYLTQLVGSRSADDLLLNVLFMLIGASLLALVGLCVGLVANGAVDPLRQRLGRICNGLLTRLHIRSSTQIPTQSRSYRSVTRR